MWAGLTESQLKTRYPSAHRDLCESPLNVHPPGGEDLSTAAARLNACIRRQMKKTEPERERGAQAAAVGMVMRPLCFAIARCALERRDPSEIWDTSRNATEPLIIDYQETAGVKARSEPGQ